MRSKRVLVVEDDADVRLGYHILLRAHNYQTFFAVDAVGALSQARQHSPDLVLLDLGLPGGGGLMVLEWFRANVHLSTIPVIVVSGRDLRTNKDLALEGGAMAFVQKPWNDEILLAIMTRLLGESEQDPGPKWDS